MEAALHGLRKFSENGEIQLRISGEVRDSSDWIFFAVRDSGIGIPPDKVDHVFEAEPPPADWTGAVTLKTK